MWDNVVNFFLNASSLAPNYTKEHCIAFKQSSSACSICQDICPHKAISFEHRKEILIDDVDCTGCGLCVQHCPSLALTSSTTYQAGAPLTCSQVKSATQSIPCLARLSPSDLLRLAGKENEVTLIRNDCNNCSVGSKDVPQTIDETYAKAHTIASTRHKSLQLKSLTLESYNTPNASTKMSRRDLLQGGWRNMQHTAADLLAVFDQSETDKHLPLEQEKQYWLLKSSSPQAEDHVPWILPRIDDACILCPVCTSVCPTKAFSRDFSPAQGEGTALMLEPERCNGCNACVSACPVNVIHLDDSVSWAELSGGKHSVFFTPSSQPSEGSQAR